MQRENRAPMMAVAEIWKSGRSLGRAHIRNLSAKGVGVIGVIQATEGEPIDIVLNGIGKVRGSVAWTGGDGFGILFSNPIDPELFDMSTPINRDVNGRAVTNNWKLRG